MRWWRPAWLGLLALAGAAALASPLQPTEVSAMAASDARPPPADDPRWRPAVLPDSHDDQVLWYRLEFERGAAARDDFWLLYLPYLYGGGKVWLNGDLIASIQETSNALRVRWERPLLLPLPTSGLHTGPNVLQLRIVAAHMPSGTGLPRLQIGTPGELQPLFDRRLFWVRTVPVITVATGIVVGLFMLFIWWRRRDEALYGLFGLAALLWAVRTTTFVYDSIPAAWWTPWRLVYHASTGGFIIVLALFTLSLAGWYRRRFAQVLAVYWLAGPLVFLLAGSNGDALIGRYWIAGLIPVGVAMVAVSIAAAVRQRSATTIALAVALAVAVLTGVHDYLVAWRSPWLAALLPAWTQSRIFLLHHGANVLLVVMGALLTARFTRNLIEVERMNRSLEARVADREAQIAASYEKIDALHREQAATEERERIMQDLHDGLGSQLFTSLLQVERGALSSTGVADMLRSCIADMRLALDAFASHDRDFRSALGNVLFRWEKQMREAGIAPAWQIEGDDDVIALPPHAALQMLRVLQEALTNVLKHSQAHQVQVRFTQTAASTRLEIEDDGIGFSEALGAPGRGLVNMRSRAGRIGAELGVQTGAGGSCVTLTLPAAPANAAVPSAALADAELGARASPT